MRKTLITCLFLIIFGFPLFAKTVKITKVDGTVIEGEIVGEYETKYVIKTIAGKVTVRKADIKGKPVVVETPLEKYGRIVKGKKVTTAEAHITIANWCKKNGLQTQYFKHLHEAIKLDPENETANKAMGKVRYQDKKMVDGKLVVKLIWVTQKEYERLHEEELAEVARVKGRNTGTATGGKKKRGTSLKDSLPPVDLEDWQKEFAMPYIRNLGANSWRLQDAAVNTLISQEFTDKLIPLILKTVFDGSDKAREAALEALIRLPYPHLLPFLEDRMLNDKAKNVITKAIYGLGEMGDAHSVSILLKALDKADPETTREILSSLESITFLPSGALFSKPDPTAIKNKYKGWLSNHSGKKRLEILELVQSKGEPNQKILAVRKLYQMGNFTCLQTLIDLLRHEDEFVQGDANRALVDLTGLDKGFKASMTYKPTKDMYIQQWVDWFKGESERKKNEPGTTKSSKPLVATDTIFLEIGDGGETKDKAKKTIFAMRKKASIPLLIRGLNNGDFFVRVAVFSWLMSMTKAPDDQGYDPKEENEAIRMAFVAKWEKWWENNQDKFED